jgi:hypothetical protein
MKRAGESASSINILQSEHMATQNHRLSKISDSPDLSTDILLLLIESSFSMMSFSALFAIWYYGAASAISQLAKLDS